MKIMSHGEEILHNGFMVNKSPNQKKKKKSIIQILDNYDIDGKCLCYYEKDRYQMYLTPNLITCVVSIDPCGHCHSLKCPNLVDE